MEFAQKLDQLMRERKLSAYKVANDIHCSQTTVRNWLSGLSMPQPRTVLLLCDYFGVSEDELMCRPQNAQKNNPGTVSNAGAIDDPELIELYLRLNDLGRQRIKDFARGLLASSED